MYPLLQLQALAAATFPFPPMMVTQLMQVVPFKKVLPLAASQTQVLFLAFQMNPVRQEQALKGKSTIFCELGTALQSKHAVPIRISPSA